MFQAERTGQRKGDSILCTLFCSQIVGLIKIKDNDPTVVFERLHHVAAKMGYQAGISNAFTDLRKIKAYYQQACYAADHASLTGEQRNFRLFRDETLSYMVSNCTAELPPETILPEDLIHLARLDAQKGSEYIKTLDTYLKHEMNVSKTADALFIHRSSLTKRLEKIEGLLYHDLKDPDDRLLLRLSLKILEDQ